MAFVGDNSASSVSFMKAIRGGVAKDLGLTIVADEVFTPPLADATTLVQKIRSGRPDFIVMQSTNVGDDKLLLDKFAERGITANTIPLVGGGGHWTVPELVKVAGTEHLEGVIVGLANWPGKAVGDVEKRFIAKTGEPWFGHDSIFPYAHVMIFKEALERTGSADRKKLGETMHKIDLKDGPAKFFPDGRVKYDESRPPRRRRAVHRAVAEGPPGGRASGEHRRLEGDLAEVVGERAVGGGPDARGRRVPLPVQAALRLPCSSSAGVPSFQGSGTS